MSASCVEVEVERDREVEVERERESRHPARPSVTCVEVEVS